jgi:hypothetical protein
MFAMLGLLLQRLGYEEDTIADRVVDDKNDGPVDDDGIIDDEGDTETDTVDMNQRIPREIATTPEGAMFAPDENFEPTVFVANLSEWFEDEDKQDEQEVREHQQGDDPTSCDLQCGEALGVVVEGNSSE